MSRIRPLPRPHPSEAILIVAFVFLSVAAMVPYRGSLPVNGLTCIGQTSDVSCPPIPQSLSARDTADLADQDLEWTSGGTPGGWREEAHASGDAGLDEETMSRGYRSASGIGVRTFGGSSKALLTPAMALRHGPIGTIPYRDLGYRDLIAASAALRIASMFRP